MIFYFSATGNSLWVAKELSKVFNEPIISIADELNDNSNEFIYILQEHEKVFFVFPVHSWGLATLVKRFIERIQIINYCEQKVYSVCTCGSDCAYTNRIVKNDLEKRGIRLSACYSILMPNTYILMKGFDTDEKIVEYMKLRQAPRDLHKIVQVIQGASFSKFLYHRSCLPRLKSYLLYPLFLRINIGKNAFHTTDKCLSCGHCEKNCPTKNIRIENGKPQWMENCVQCTACIHRCPVQSIECLYAHHSI